MPSPSCAGVVVSRRRRARVLVCMCPRRRRGGLCGARGTARLRGSTRARVYLCVGSVALRQALWRGSAPARAADRPRGTRPRGGVLSRVFCIQTERGIAKEVSQLMRYSTPTMYHFYSKNSLKEGIISVNLAREQDTSKIEKSTVRPPRQPPMNRRRVAPPSNKLD